MLEFAWAFGTAGAVTLVSAIWFFRREALRERESKRLDAAFYRARSGKRISYTGRPFGQ